MCNQSFIFQKSLNQHMTSKHSEKNVECSQCKTKFTNDQNLKRHMKIVHEKVLNVQCNLCEKKFSKHSKMMEHIETIHERIKHFKCEKCEKRFSHKLERAYFKST